MQQIVGPGSILNMVITNIEQNILLDPTFDLCQKNLTIEMLKEKAYVDYCKQLRDHEAELINYQWGSGAFLNNSRYYISGIAPINGGISNTNFSDYLFYSAPEYGTYLQNTALNDEDATKYALNFTQSQILLNRNVTDPAQANGTAVRVQSLLNPDNLHVLFLGYYEKKYSLLRKRFGLDSDEQVDYLHSYLHY